MGKALAAWLMVAAAVAAPVVSPRDVVQNALARVVALMQDGEAAPGDTPVPAKPSRDGIRAEIRRIALETFDFEEMSRRALSRHWATRTAAEHAEFTRLFTDLLERAYVGKIEAFAGEKVVYLGSAVEGPYATVRSKVVRRARPEVALDYRLHLTDGRWKVYDLIVDGISFVSTYRAEFNRVIESSSFDNLMARMRKREMVAEHL